MRLTRFQTVGNRLSTFVTIVWAVREDAASKSADSTKKRDAQRYGQEKQGNGYRQQEKPQRNADRTQNENDHPAYADLLNSLTASFMTNAVSRLIKRVPWGIGAPPGSACKVPGGQFQASVAFRR